MEKVRLWKLPGRAFVSPDGKPKPAKFFLAPKYPHMGPWESVIWEDFLLTTDLKFVAVWYDVRVGPGFDPGEGYEDYIREMAKALTKLRIDACAQGEKYCWVFEVKPRAGRSALGQVISYAHWIQRDYPPPLPLRLAVVCREIDPNMPPVYESRGIVVFVVPETLERPRVIGPYSPKKYKKGRATSSVSVRELYSGLSRILRRSRGVV